MILNLHTIESISELARCTFKYLSRGCYNFEGRYGPYNLYGRYSKIKNIKLSLWHLPNLSAILIFIICLWPSVLWLVNLWSCDPSRLVYFFSLASTAICPIRFDVIGIFIESTFDTPGNIIWIMPARIVFIITIIIIVSDIFQWIVIVCWHWSFYIRGSSRTVRVWWPRGNNLDIPGWDTVSRIAGSLHYFDPCYRITLFRPLTWIIKIAYFWRSLNSLKIYCIHTEAGQTKNL